MKPEELDQITSLLAQSGDRQAALEETLRCVLKLLNSETGTIHRLDHEKQLLHLTVQIGLPTFMMDIVKTIPVGKGIAGETVVRGGPVTMCNLQTDTSGVAKAGAKQTGVGGTLCVPKISVRRFAWSVKAVMVKAAVAPPSNSIVTT